MSFSNHTKQFNKVAKTKNFYSIETYIKSPTGYTYNKGLDGLYGEYIKRRTPLLFEKGELPAADIDFAPLKSTNVPTLPKCEPSKKENNSFSYKKAKLRPRFSGKPELHFLVGCLIMMSRRDNFPTEMKELWYRLWEEEWEFLVDTLSLRWKVSSLMTFGEHGKSEAERHLGREIFLLISMMKLHDTERSFSGVDGDQVFNLKGRSENSKKATTMGLSPYAIRFGDLDRNILSVIYDKILDCDGTPCAWISRSIFDELNRAPDTIFRRIHKMRQQHPAQHKKKEAASVL